MPFWCSIKSFALFQIRAFKWPSNYKYFVFFLSNSKINSIIHHLTYSLELFGSNIKLDDLRAGDIRRPIKSLWFITTNNQYVLFIQNNNLTLTYLSIKDFKWRPSKCLKVIKCMLIQLCKVKESLRKAIIFRFLIFILSL